MDVERTSADAGDSIELGSEVKLTGDGGSTFPLFVDPPRKPALNPAKGSSKVALFGDRFGAFKTGTARSCIPVSILMTGLGNMLPPIFVADGPGESGGTGTEESNDTDFLRGVEDLRIDLGCSVDEEDEVRRVGSGIGFVV